MEDMIVWVKIAKCFAAALAIGLGTMGPALSQGKIGATGCDNIGRYPQSEGAIRNMTLLALTIVETSALFAFITALLLIFAIN
ncbi:MAG: ATP synthase C chain [candidate division TM6 bacterium GW2011_GWE2_41_16]|nr:MAG: ATP synthase C chain [candidate division TM6 bacterium GW2011_GWE2_41_16]